MKDITSYVEDAMCDANSEGDSGINIAISGEKESTIQIVKAIACVESIECTEVGRYDIEFKKSHRDKLT